jgi:hypothetical protein
MDMNRIGSWADIRNKVRVGKKADSGLAVKEDKIGVDRAGNRGSSRLGKDYIIR